MTAFRAALNPDRSKRCTPEQLLQAITVDAFNPGAWQQYDDDAAQSGQKDAMRPFDHTGLRNPRLLWRPHEPAGSGEKPTAAVTKAGMPRQTAMPGVRPALQRIIGQSAPSPYATVPPIPRLPNAGQAADAASASLRRLPSIGTGADAGTSDGTVPLRGAPLPGNIASSQAPGQRPDGADVPPHPTYAADHAGRHRSDRIVAPTADIGSAHLHHAIRFHGQRRTNHAHATAADDGPTHGRCGHDRSNGRNRAVIIRRHRGNPSDG